MHLQNLILDGGIPFGDILLTAVHLFHTLSQGGEEHFCVKEEEGGEGRGLPNLRVLEPVSVRKEIGPSRTLPNSEVRALIAKSSFGTRLSGNVKHTHIHPFLQMQCCGALLPVLR